MEPAFSLLEEPWLPVRLSDERIVSLGLLDIFERSNEIVALAETEPPSLVAQYRLLLAILHRALTQHLGRWRDTDRARWYRDGLPLDAVRKYLESHRERFWLFHPEHPFMQVAALDRVEKIRDKVKPWTKISLGSANADSAVVFDHAYDGQPKQIAPEQAIRTLLGFLQFTPGGLVKALRSSSDGGSDKAGALANTAAVIPIGMNLAQTLMLCLHGASDSRVDDLPSWECVPLDINQLGGARVPATGPNDRYTRQSRAVLFLREENDSVRWLRFTEGYPLADDKNVPDPMASFRAGSNGPVRISFAEGRAMWRDLPAILPGVISDGVQSRSAAVLNCAAVLHETDNFDSVYQPVIIAGLASEPGRQAKVARWRVEQFRLPCTLLEDGQCVVFLQNLIADSESFYVKLRKLSEKVLAHTLPDPSKKKTFEQAQKLVKTGPLAVTYFAAAERALPEMMAYLGQYEFDKADQCWRRALRLGAEEAWKRMVAGLGYTSKALRAEAQFYPRFRALLNREVPDKNNPQTEEA